MKETESIRHVPGTNRSRFAPLALRAVCDYAFRHGGIRRLTATVTAGNIASRRTLEKQGFMLEGELRESYFLGGQWQNDWLFGLLSHEFDTSRTSGQ